MEGIDLKLCLQRQSQEILQASIRKSGLGRRWANLPGRIQNSLRCVPGFRETGGGFA